MIQKIVNTQEFFSSDIQFDLLYPPSIQQLSKKHWTPLKAALRAADYLAAEPKVKILDIGSGVGKFCLSAAFGHPDAFYYGIEQRKNLISYAEAAKEKLGFRNVTFIPGNFTQVNFQQYDHFYFYNSFYENISGIHKIDSSIDYSYELYKYYNRYLNKQLEKMRPGTKLVTFHSMREEVPKGYEVVGTEMNELLKFWIKAA